MARRKCVQQKMKKRAREREKKRMNEFSPPPLTFHQTLPSPSRAAEAAANRDEDWMSPRALCRTLAAPARSESALGHAFGRGRRCCWRCGEALLLLAENRGGGGNDAADDGVAAAAAKGVVSSALRGNTARALLARGDTGGRIMGSSLRWWARIREPKPLSRPPPAAAAACCCCRSCCCSRASS